MPLGTELSVLNYIYIYILIKVKQSFSLVQKQYYFFPTKPFYLCMQQTAKEEDARRHRSINCKS